MITAINSNQNFTSRLNPIKPFSVVTKNGKIDFCEVQIQDLKKDGFLTELTDFFLRNFASNTRNEFWKSYNKKPLSEEWRFFFNYYKDYYRKIFSNDDGHTTLLLGFDKNNKIRAGCFSFTFNEIPLKDKMVCCVDSIAVDKRFRGKNLGKIMLDKTIDISKGVFNDMFLIAENLALGFYDKQGFRKLNPKNSSEKVVINFLAEKNFDYPKEISFLTKTLQKDKPRWFEAAEKAILSAMDLE